jgi:hypothetical protein
MSDYVSVPIDRELYNEFILRAGRSVDVAQWIENIVADFLQRTEGDDLVWGDTAREPGASSAQEYGPPHKGLYWQNVFLKNGTRLRMNYAGQEWIAEIRHGSLIFDGREMTPSQFAREVAGHNRNAWRDLYIRFPNENRWQLADVIRQGAAKTA